MTVVVSLTYLIFFSVSTLIIKVPCRANPTPFWIHINVWTEWIGTYPLGTQLNGATRYAIKVQVNTSALNISATVNKAESIYQNSRMQDRSHINQSVMLSRCPGQPISDPISSSISQPLRCNRHIDASTEGRNTENGTVK